MHMARVHETGNGREGAMKNKTYKATSTIMAAAMVGGLSLAGIAVASAQDTPKESTSTSATEEPRATTSESSKVSKTSKTSASKPSETTSGKTSKTDTPKPSGTTTASKTSEPVEVETTPVNE